MEPFLNIRTIVRMVCIHSFSMDIGNEVVEYRNN